MQWVGFLIGSPVRLGMTVVVSLILISVFWPGVVAHALYVLVYVLFTGVVALVFGIKWLLVCGVVGIGVYMWLRYL